MAITVLTNVSVTYNSVDLSDHVESVEINMEYDQVEVTAMGATSRNYALGLRDDSVTLNFYQDFAAAKVDQTIAALLGNSSGASMVIKPTTSAVSTVNPSYTLTAIPFSYTPLNGSVGEASMTSIEFRCAAGSAIVRATT